MAARYTIERGSHRATTPVHLVAATTTIPDINLRASGKFSRYVVEDGGTLRGQFRRQGRQSICFGEGQPSRVLNALVFVAGGVEVLNQPFRRAAGLKAIQIWSGLRFARS